MKDLFMKDLFMKDLFMKDLFMKDLFMKDLFMKDLFMKELFMKDLFLHFFIPSFLHFPMWQVRPRGGVKELNSTGFIRFCDMAGPHSRLSEKPNAFLMLF